MTRKAASMRSCPANPDVDDERHGPRRSELGGAARTGPRGGTDEDAARGRS